MTSSWVETFGKPDIFTRGYTYFHVCVPAIFLLLRLLLDRVHWDSTQIYLVAGGRGFLSCKLFLVRGSLGSVLQARLVCLEIWHVFLVVGRTWRSQFCFWRPKSLSRFCTLDLAWLGGRCLVAVYCFISVLRNWTLKCWFFVSKRLNCSSYPELVGVRSIFLHSRWNIFTQRTFILLNAWFKPAVCRS